MSDMLWNFDRQMSRTQMLADTTTKDIKSHTTVLRLIALIRKLDLILRQDHSTDGHVVKIRDNMPRAHFLVLMKLDN